MYTPGIIIQTVSETVAEGVRELARAAHAVSVSPQAGPSVQAAARGAAYSLAKVPRPVVHASRELVAQATRVSPSYGAVAVDGAVAAAAAVFAAGVLRFAARALVRYPTAGSVPEAAFRSHRVIRGRVAAVTDGDNLRIYHQPWGWRALLGGWTPSTHRKLSVTTIHLRLAGIDAPEAAHFGRPGQPYAEEAREWLDGFAAGKAVRVKLLKRDMYGRALASVAVDRLSLPYKIPVPLVNLIPFTWWTDVSLALVKAGYGDVYDKGGAEYDGNLAALTKARDKARSARRGMWKQGASYVSPMDFKASHSDVA